jgi:hypothetical protein
MKTSSIFAVLIAVGTAVLAISGCGGNVGPAPSTSGPPIPPLPTPAAKWLYVDHYGTLYQYQLPLSTGSKPVRTLTEWPGLGSGIAPAIAVGPYGEVALSDNQEIRVFLPPIVSFDSSHAKLSLKLTPAITEVGPYGADLIDMEYDPNDNLWLFNNLGGEVSELRPPLTKHSLAALTFGFGQPGSKTAGYTMVQGRLDVNSTLYIYATTAGARARLFKDSFPYAKQPSSIGINLAQADFVDASQYLPTSKNPADLLLGQYTGELRTPKPGAPPSPPVDVMGQFYEPLQPTQGLIPNDHVDTVVRALIADPPRERFYVTESSNGELDVFGLPLQGGAKPVLKFNCLAGTVNCEAASQHLFLAP